MKLSSVILLVTFVLLVTALFASNILLKAEYDKIDKSDAYWTYGNILEQPFKHLKIEGGNVTNIAFEQSKKSSVRVFKNWYGYVEKVVKAYVKNDTLFLKFPSTATKDPYEKNYLQWNTMVRIFSPELLSVDGFDTNFGLFKLKQKSITIHLSGKSKLEVESYGHNFDSIYVTQKDSSEVVFEMSPDLKGSGPAVAPGIEQKGLAVHAEKPGLDSLSANNIISNSWEALYIKAVKADIQGGSLLDLGHAQINSLHLTISDTSAIILSGQALRNFKDKKQQ